jgi:riboflavin-specific deaminase-like protein
MLGVLGDPTAERPYLVGHLAQSLDGRIALPCGSSQWITGEADLHHTHQLRALCDAVMVGTQTVASDDPRLTVRRVHGPQPLRIVLDPRGRLPLEREVFGDGHPTLRVGRLPARQQIHGWGPDQHAVDELLLPGEGPLDLVRLLRALRQRGIRRLFVEGGGVTLGHLLAAGVVDRLHLVMAPMLVGHGKPSVSAVLSGTLDGCPRPRVRMEPLGDDVLFDCAFDGSEA